MNNEKWRPINGYYGLYEVSNYGHVRSVKREGTKGGTLKQKTRNGYLCVDLCKNGKKSSIDVHRLVACEFVENPNGLPQVNHIDEDKHNNNSANLEWCSIKQNINHGTARDRTNKTRELERTPFVDLTTGKVYTSRKKYAEEYGITHGYVSNLLYGRRKSNKYRIKLID